MRPRKIKNLTTRRENCSDLRIPYTLESFDFRTDDIKESFFDLDAIFGRSAPLVMEIGCGKGGFVIALAKENPQVNYVALEKMSNVILTPLEAVKELGLTNVRFLNVRAECLPCYIPENSLDCIYLNFSTPLPKLGYASQRLTHRNFLEKYKKLLKKGGRIIQKTDDRDFFDFSLEEYTACGFKLENVSYNLHEYGNPKWNIVTEYEQKWVERGLPIHRVEAVSTGEEE